MKLSSPDFQDMQPLPVSCGYHFDNICPVLHVSDIPSNTKSLALIVDDPDAPGGSFIHWLAWNIPTDIESIKSNLLPSDVIEGKNDFGNNRYDGPAPPNGTHRYIFELYAINNSLNLPESSTIHMLKNEINKYIFTQANITGLFSAK